MKLNLRVGSLREVFGAVTWNFTGMFFSLITGILTARILAPDDRGLLALALTISSLSYLFSSVGTNTAVRTLQPRETWASFRTYLQVSILLLCLNALVVTGTVLFFALLGFAEFSDHVVTIGILGVFTFTSNQLLDVFNAAGRASQSAMANTVGHFTTMAVLLVVFFVIPEWADLQGVLTGYLLSFLFRILIMMVLSRREGFELGLADGHNRRKFFRASVNFWGISLSQTLTFRSDQFLLGLLSNAHNLGIYAVAVTPSSLMQVVANSIGQVVHREAAVSTLTQRRLWGFLLAGIFISSSYALFLWLTAPFLIPLVFGSSYIESVEVVRVLVISGVILSPYSILVRALSGFNYPHTSSLSGIVGIAVLVPALITLVPLHGAIGAAFGTIISYTGMLLVVSVGVILHYRRLS